MWEAGPGSRFQEVDSEDEDAGPARARLGYAGFNLRDKQRYEGYGGMAYGEDYGYPQDPQGYYYDDPMWLEHTEMRQKEEELVDTALRRIRRAKLQGESDVALSREELDALERRQLVPQLAAPRPRPQAPGPSQPASNSKRQRSSAPRPAAKLVKPAPNLNLEPSTSRSSTRLSRQNSREQTRDTTRQSSTASRASAQGHGASRTSSRQARKQTSTASPSFHEAQHYALPGPRRRISRGASPARSLPDDPDWTPRVRSSSSTQLHASGVDPYGYPMPQRRHVSGPAGLSHPVPRRPGPPPGRSAPYGSEVVRMPLARNSSSDLALGRRVASGLSNEVIEISSDDEEEDESEEEAEEEDSEDDDGVRVEVVPTVVTRSSSTRNKLRKGRK